MLSVGIIPMPQVDGPLKPPAGVMPVPLGGTSQWRRRTIVSSDSLAGFFFIRAGGLIMLVVLIRLIFLICQVLLNHTTGFGWELPRRSSLLAVTKGYRQPCTSIVRTDVIQYRQREELRIDQVGRYPGCYRSSQPLLRPLPDIRSACVTEHRIDIV